MSENQNNQYLNLDSLSDSWSNPTNPLNNNQTSEESNNSQKIQSKNNKTSSFFKWFITWILVIIWLSILIWIFAKEEIINNYINPISKPDCSITNNQEINSINNNEETDEETDEEIIEGNKNDYENNTKNDEYIIEDDNKVMIMWPSISAWWKSIEFKAVSDKKITTYWRDFGDGSMIRVGNDYSHINHYYWYRWIYSVRLTVTFDDGSSSTYEDEIIIWEPDHIIAWFSVMDIKWNDLKRHSSCKFLNDDWFYDKTKAYSTSVNQEIIINSARSKNKEWTSEWLVHIYKKEDRPPLTSTDMFFTTIFNETGCHYVDFTVKDTNDWTQDKVRIWFNVE